MNITKLFWRAYHAHVLLVAFVFGLFAMVMIGLQQNLAKTESSVKTSLGVVAFLQSSMTDPQAAQLAQTLKSQDPEILSIEYTSKEQAFAEAMKDPNLAKSLQLLKANPLPASLTLHYSERAQWERSQPAEPIKATPGIQEIRWDPQAYGVYRSVHQWRLWCVRFSGFLGVTLLVWAFIGLYRFLSLQGRSQEILIVLSVGMIGGFLAWGLWSIGLRSLQAEINTLQPIWIWLTPLAIGIASALGCFGLEVRRAD